MQLLRRFVLLVSLIFWQGGFMFYGGVVVPVGSHVLGSDTQQGFITQAVTNYLNLAGIVCLLVWCLDYCCDRQRGVSKLEWFSLLLMFALQIVLVVVHLKMDQLLDGKTTSVIDPRQFGTFHKIYIGSSSLQWMIGLFMLLLALRRWCRSPGATTPEP